MLAIFILYVLFVLIQDIYNSYSRRFAIFSAFIFSIPLITIGSISHLNIYLANESVLCDNFILTDKSIKEHDDYNGYYFHFTCDDEELSFEMDQETWDKFSFGDIIEVCFIDGYFGYDKVAFIDKFEPKWDE